MAWLAYVGLYQHETPCPGSVGRCNTIYGYGAPVPDEHPLGIVLLVGTFSMAAAWTGLRRSARALEIGAALVVGPLILAGWTAPRGDNDGLWSLVFLLLPVAGGFAASIAAIAERIGDARHSVGGLPVGEVFEAPFSDRLAALGIDLAILFAILIVPLTALSRAKFEVIAALIGAGVSTMYLALTLTWRGRTPGQAAIGLFVLDATTFGPLSLTRALGRSLVVVLEVAAFPTFVFALPGVVDLFVLVRTGQTVTDRLIGAVVVSSREPLTAKTA